MIDEQIDRSMLSPSLAAPLITSNTRDPDRRRFQMGVDGDSRHSQDRIQHASSSSGKLLTRFWSLRTFTIHGAQARRSLAEWHRIRFVNLRCPVIWNAESWALFMIDVTHDDPK